MSLRPQLYDSRSDERADSTPSAPRLRRALKGLFGLVPAAARVVEHGSWPSIALLVFLFVLSFAIPIVAALQFSRLWHPRQENGPEPQLFQDALHINSSGTYLRIKNSPKLNPDHGRDFLVSAWFRLPRLPAAGERVTLFAKYDPKAENIPGYALALEGETDAVRPLVYWRDRAGKGRWISFQEASILPRTWTLFVLSVRDGHLLGLHSAMSGVPGGEKLSLLGGHDLGEEVLAASDADLIIGAYNNNRFRGGIGRIGVFVLPNLGERFSTLTRELIADPNTLPKDVLERQVGLWYQHGVDAPRAAELGVQLEQEGRGREQREE